MKLRNCSLWIGIACLVGVVALAGCKKNGGSRETEAPKSDAADAAQNTEVLAKLAKADAFDGAEDHVVSKCASCRLGMDGDEANTLTVGDYQMHFCSPGCKERFSKDLTKNVLALAIPEGG